MRIEEAAGSFYAGKHGCTGVRGTNTKSENPGATEESHNVKAEREMSLMSIILDHLHPSYGSGLWLCVP